MTNQLTVLLNGREVGAVSYRNARISFHYDKVWRQDQDAYPLSLSMPLASAEHGHATVEAFLWGLLPDNDRVLNNWARRFQVSARNAFRLIAHVGEDCAGAVQFVRPDRMETIHGKPGEIAWLTEDEIAERLRALRADHSAWRAASDTGQFSLAGAQPKTALLLERSRWGIPSGRTPTTHILKPPTGEWDGHAENEHFCLLLARASGLVVPNSRVRRFRNEIAIVIERYDRVRSSAGGWLRVHQEDMCQALGLHPAQKYESEGGPGVLRIADFLRENSSNPGEDVQAFLDAIAFNWLIAGTDGHAKNYALLLGARGAVRLAPLYDLASILPYRNIDVKKAKLAMKIGGEYRLANISMRNWRRLATEVGMEEELIIDRLRAMTAGFPDLAARIQNQVEAEGLSHPTVTTLAERLKARSAACQRLLEMGNRSISHR
jgi:serine/threonine-protein kinase HipA